MILAKTYAALKNKDSIIDEETLLQAKFFATVNFGRLSHVDSCHPCLFISPTTSATIFSNIKLYCNILAQLSNICRSEFFCKKNGESLSLPLRRLSTQIQSSPDLIP